MSPPAAAPGDLYKSVESLLSSGQFDLAVANCRAALSDGERALGNDADGLIEPLVLLGRSLAHRASASSKEVTELGKRAVDIASERFGETDIRTARVLCNVSLNFRGCGLLNEAIALLSRALGVADEIRDAEQSLWSLRLLTNSLLQVARYSEALELCERLQGREEEREQLSYAKMLANYQLGLCLLRLGHKQRATMYLGRASELRAELKPGAKNDELEALLHEASSE